MGKKKVKYNYKKEVCEEIFFKILYDDTGYFKEWYKETGGRSDLYIPEFRDRIIMDYLNEQEAWATDPNACASHLKKNKKLLKKRYQNLRETRAFRSSKMRHKNSYVFNSKMFR